MILIFIQEEGSHSMFGEHFDAVERVATSSIGLLGSKEKEVVELSDIDKSTGLHVHIRLSKIRDNFHNIWVKQEAYRMEYWVCDDGDGWKSKFPSTHVNCSGTCIILPAEEARIWG